MNKFLDSKRGIEIVGAFIVWGFCLMVANYADIFTAETNKNAAGIAAVVFIMIIEWRREVSGDNV